MNRVFVMIEINDNNADKSELHNILCVKWYAKCTTVLSMRFFSRCALIVSVILLFAENKIICILLILILSIITSAENLLC